MQKAADDVDRHVGTRIRLRRMLMGVTQEKLASGIGVAFQQLQKYESGANRVSAGRLRKIAEILKVPVDYLYEGSGGERAAGRADGDVPGPDVDPFDSESVNLLRAFHLIPQPAVRRKLIELVTAIAGRPDRDQNA